MHLLALAAMVLVAARAATASADIGGDQHGPAAARRETLTTITTPAATSPAPTTQPAPDVKAPVPPAPRDEAASWSEASHGLQARITLVERPRINGTRSLVPYLELRNVGDSAEPLKVRCGSGHVRFELVGADGKVLRDGSAQPRSGPHPDPGTVALPFDSSIRIGMHCNNWGVPKDAAAMIATDSGAWVLQSQERAKVFLRATVAGAEAEPDPDLAWRGKLETPPVKVDWSE